MAFIYIYIVFPLCFHGETLFCIMGRHTVGHMQQELVQCAQQNHQIKHEDYGLHKGSELENNKNREGWTQECFLREVSGYTFT